MYKLIEANSWLQTSQTSRSRQKAGYDKYLTGRTTNGWKSNKGKNTLLFKPDHKFDIQHYDIKGKLEKEGLLEDLDYPEYKIDLPYAPNYNNHKTSRSYHRSYREEDIDVSALNLKSSYILSYGILAHDVKFCSMNNFLKIVNDIGSDLIDEMSIDLLKIGIIKSTSSENDNTYILINSEFDFDKCGFFFGETLKTDKSVYNGTGTTLNWNNSKNYCHDSNLNWDDINNEWLFIKDKDESPFMKPSIAPLSGDIHENSYGEYGKLKCSLIKDNIKTTKTGDDFLSYMKSRREKIIVLANTGLKRTVVTQAKSGLVLNSIKQWMVSAQVQEIFSDEYEVDIEVDMHASVTLKKEGMKNNITIALSNILPSFNNTSEVIALHREMADITLMSNDLPMERVKFECSIYEFENKDIRLTKTKYMGYKERSSFKYMHNFIKLSLTSIKLILDTIQKEKEDDTITEV